MTTTLDVADGSAGNIKGLGQFVLIPLAPSTSLKASPELHLDALAHALLLGTPQLGHVSRTMARTRSSVKSYARMCV